MDPNDARKFNRLIWRGRLWTGLKILSILVPIAVIFVFLGVDKNVVGFSTTDGIVETWSRTQNLTDGGRYVVQVRLDDDSMVSVFASARGRPPVIGEKIEIVRLETASGRVVHSWKNY